MANALSDDKLRTVDILSKMRRSLPPNNDCERVLTKVFGHSEFKGKQKEIVEAAYGGADVLVVAPTGMGKSLCFQIPAVAEKRGVTLVVSPLLALMQNQLESLERRNIVVASLSSQTEPREKENIINALKEYDIAIKLLYVTPERVNSSEFFEILDAIYENHNLNRLVVDEAHCISEWGHNFRKEYRRLGKFRQHFPDVPIMALTATATLTVQKDIIRSLQMEDKHLYRALHPFNRSNLYYEIKYMSNTDVCSQMENIFQSIVDLYGRRGSASSGIIYCRERKTCDELSKFLRGKGLNAQPYHRGIPSATLAKTLKSWTSGPSEGGVDLVVATIAFGLGIDKGNVRYVIHFDLPKSFEGYYQETGRAGRDGLPAKCTLYFSREDIIRVKRYVNTSNPHRVRDDDDDGPTPTQQASGSFASLVSFAESTMVCRHVSICRYFGEVIDDDDPQTLKVYCRKMCDVCRKPEATKQGALRLSPLQNAAATVAAAFRSLPGNPQQPQDRQIGYDGGTRQQTNNQKAFPSAMGKRQGGGEVEAKAAKRLKAAHPMVLNTKPFGSTSSLSKPFKPPTLVQPQERQRNVETDYADPGSRRRPNKAPAPHVTAQLREVETEMERESSPSIELPDVENFWIPGPSGKVDSGERQQGFHSLRTRLHRVLVLSDAADKMWSMITGKGLRGTARNEVVFSLAVELENEVHCHISTRQGYHGKILAMKDWIDGLEDLRMWDGNDCEFEESQEIIERLRCISVE